MVLTFSALMFLPQVQRTRVPFGRRFRNSRFGRCYFRVCESYLFWKIWPWVFSLGYVQVDSRAVAYLHHLILPLPAGVLVERRLLAILNFFTLVYIVKYIAFDDKIMTAFIQVRVSSTRGSALTWQVLLLCCCATAFKRWGLPDAQTYFVALAVGWVVFDVSVILIRNNNRWTSKILATKRYQIIEKFVLAPFTVAFKRLLLNIEACLDC